MNRFLVLVAALLAAANVSARGDAAAGAAKAQQVCAACHGANGDVPTTPDFPKLAGQYRDYLLHTLHAYKSGKRKNAIMAAQVQNLSSKELEDLAAYYSSQGGSLRVVR